MTTLPPVTRYQVAAWLMMAAALLLTLTVHLLPALLAGLLVMELVHMLAPRFVIGRLDHYWSKLLAVSLITLIVLGGGSPPSRGHTTIKGSHLTIKGSPSSNTPSRGHNTPSRGHIL